MPLFGVSERQTSNALLHRQDALQQIARDRDARRYQRAGQRAEKLPIQINAELTVVIARQAIDVLPPPNRLRQRVILIVRDVVANTAALKAVTPPAYEISASKAGSIALWRVCSGTGTLEMTRRSAGTP